MGVPQVKLAKVSRRIAGVALTALAGLLMIQAAAIAQQKEIAVMLPAAGDPYFKLKAAGYVDAGKKLGYDVKIYDAGGTGTFKSRSLKSRTSLSERCLELYSFPRVLMAPYRSSKRRSQPGSR
jgi:hypothetical protein